MLEKTRTNLDMDLYINKADKVNENSIFNRFIVYLPIILLTACYAIFILQQNFNHVQSVKQLKQAQVTNSVTNKYVKLPNYKLFTDIDGQVVKRANITNIIKLTELYKTHI